MRQGEPRIGRWESSDDLTRTDWGQTLREGTKTETNVGNENPRHQFLNVGPNGLPIGVVVAVHLYQLIQLIVDVPIINLVEVDRILDTGSETGECIAVLSSNMSAVQIN